MKAKIDMEKTGKRIAFLMNMNNLTPRKLMDELDLSCVQTIYHWMRGISIPKTEHLYALSGLVAVDMDAIICGNRDEVCDAKRKEKMHKLLELYFENED